MLIMILVPFVVLCILLYCNLKHKEKEIPLIERGIIIVYITYMCADSAYLRYVGNYDKAIQSLYVYAFFMGLYFYVSDYIRYIKFKDDIQTAQKTNRTQMIWHFVFMILIAGVILMDKLVFAQS